MTLGWTCWAPQRRAAARRLAPSRPMRERVLVLGEGVARGSTADSWTAENSAYH